MFPDETRSTIPSASPRRGAISTEPVTSTSVDLHRQELAGQARVHRGDRRARQVVDPLVAGLLGNGGLEPAGAEAELEQLLDPGPALADEVLAGDPAVDDAVLDVLGHVGRTDEQHVDRGVPARERERTLAGLFRAETGILEQRDGRLAQAPLDRDGDRQTVDAAALCRSSAKR